MSPDVLTPASVPCAVRMHLSGGKLLRGKLFLLLDESREGGVIPLDRVFDDCREFIPVGIEGGRSILISRNSIAAVEILEEQAEAFLPYQSGGSLDIVSLTLDTGHELSGLLQSLSPVDAVRTSDVFNDAERFVILQVEDRRILVSKAHIVQISF
jgi:hypothetical protein